MLVYQKTMINRYSLETRFEKSIFVVPIMAGKKHEPLATNDKNTFDSIISIMAVPNISNHPQVCHLFCKICCQRIDNVVSRGMTMMMAFCCCCCLFRTDK